MEELVFASDPKFLKRIWDLQEDEVLLRCPVCNERMIFAPDWRRAQKYGVHPGAYCSVDRKHLTVMFEIKTDSAVPSQEPRDAANNKIQKS